MSNKDERHRNFDLLDVTIGLILATIIAMALSVLIEALPADTFSFATAVIESAVPAA